MRTIETTATITAEGTLTVQVPPDILPGPHHIVVWIDDQPGLPDTRARHDFPVIHVGAWPADLSLRREDMYDDDLALVTAVPTRGRRIHDANIVATMLVSGVRRVLTHNTDDFVRFAAFIEVIPLLPPQRPRYLRAPDLLPGGRRMATASTRDVQRNAEGTSWSKETIGVSEEKWLYGAHLAAAGQRPGGHAEGGERERTPSEDHTRTARSTIDGSGNGTP